MSIVKLAATAMALPMLVLGASTFAASRPATSTSSTASTASVTNISDPQTFASQHGIPLTHNGQPLIGLKVVTPASITAPSTGNGIATPDWPWNSPEIRDVVYDGLVYNTADLLASATGTGPTTLILSRTTTISNNWSASASVSASIVSAAVGFNVTNSTSWTIADDQQVPSGVTETVEAYPEYQQYTFQVWEPNTFNGGYTEKGTGVAHKAVGIYYALY